MTGKQLKELQKVKEYLSKAYELTSFLLFDAEKHKNPKINFYSRLDDEIHDLIRGINNFIYEQLNDDQTN